MSPETSGGDKSLLTPWKTDFDASEGKTFVVGDSPDPNIPPDPFDRDGEGKSVVAT